ncbi:MAG: hypothetical protein AAF736_18890 [Pseudomonadota bacterium]
MSKTVFTRPGVLIAAVLGAQTLALGIMLSAAYLMSSLGEGDQVVDVFTSECVSTAAVNAPVDGKTSRRLLDLSVGWLR